MIEWIKKLINLGAQRPLNFEQSRSIKVLNLIALLTIASGSVFLVLNLLANRYVLSALNGITISAGLLMLYFHYRGLFNNGYVILTSVGSLVFFSSSLLYRNNMEFYLLLITILSVILMKDVWLRIFFGIINSVAFLFVYRYGNDISYLADVGDERRFVNILIWLIILLIIAWYFNFQGTNRQKLIEEKNDLLEEHKLKLEHSNQKLSILNNTKEKLLSIIAHDVRSPIAGLKGVLDLYNDDNLSNDELRDLSAQMTKQLDHLHSNLDNLLQWSHSQLHGIEVNPVPFNIKHITEETVRLMSNNLSVKQLLLEMNIPENCIVLADSNQVQIIIRNLISNAIKFSYPGGKIQVTALKRDSSVLVSVKDEGTGINPEVLSTLFSDNQLINTEYGTQNEKGHGVGLLLCKEFAIQNRGSITVESEYGKGSCFILTLPAH